jgi:hypothetical protein
MLTDCCIRRQKEYFQSRCERRVYLLTHEHSIAWAVDGVVDDAAAAAAGTYYLSHNYVPYFSNRIVLPDVKNVGNKNTQ